MILDSEKSSLERRLKANCAANGRCLEWTGSRNARGYGQIRTLSERRRPTPRLVHRVAFEMYLGPIPDGDCVLHSCDNPSCFRLDHLHLGSRLDNNREMSERHRVSCGDQHYGSRLTGLQVSEMRTRYRLGESQADLARVYRTHQSNVSRIVRDLYWKH